MQITPTINFGGNCREAIQLYEKAFEGKDYIYHAVLSVACGLLVKRQKSVETHVLAGR